MLELAIQLDGCAALRYPRGEVHDGLLEHMGIAQCSPVEYGKAEILSQGADLTIVAVGSMVATALEVALALGAQGLDVGVINARWVKPLDRSALLRAADDSGCIVTLEENVLTGGFGSAVLEVLETEDMLGRVRIKRFGVPDNFVEHGANGILLQMLGLDVGHLVEQIVSFVRTGREAVVS